MLRFVICSMLRKTPTPSQLPISMFLFVAFNPIFTLPSSQTLPETQPYILSDPIKIEVWLTGSVVPLSSYRLELACENPARNQ